MTKYNLILFFSEFNPDYKNDVIMAISPIITSENFTYLYNSKNFIFHFESDLNEEQIRNYVHDAFYGNNINGIFVSKTDNMSVYLPNNDIEWFYKLDSDSMESNLSVVNMTNIKNGIDGFKILEFLEEDDDDDDDVKKIIREAKKKIQIPTLDDLLEKIYENGIDSLTTDEHTILKTYIK